jgi:protein O-GlcNAc transferase
MLRPLGQAGEWSEVETLGERLRQVLHSEAPEAFPPFSIVTLPSTAEEQLTCARTWVSHRFQSVERLRPSLGFRPEPSIKPQLRLGYISSDFREHAVGRLMVDLIETHDRELFEVVGYSIGPDDGSELGVRIRRAFDSFVDLNTISSIEAAQRIYADGIDILVDLNGHTKGSRSEILALCPAPVQVNFLGNPQLWAHPLSTTSSPTAS